MEPLARALKELGTDAWVNGRRRDHGAERARLEVFEGGSPAKARLRFPSLASSLPRFCCCCSGSRPKLGFAGPEAALPKLRAPPRCVSPQVNPLAFWTFEDCFDFLEESGTPGHPLHAEGYPSIGDVHSTLPVPREKCAPFFASFRRRLAFPRPRRRRACRGRRATHRQSPRRSRACRWFEYGGERKGRFQGLQNADGSDKTECGIHNKMGGAAASSSIIGGGGGGAASSIIKPPAAASSSLKPPQ